MRALPTIAAVAFACGTDAATGWSGGDDDPGPGPGPSSAEECGNGVDDDSDGTIDDGCPCEPGTTQPCSLAPFDECPGTQRCLPGDEFGRWGECEVPSCDPEPAPGVDGGPPPQPGGPDGGPPSNATCAGAIDVTPSGPGVTVTVTGTTCGSADGAGLWCSTRAAPEVFYVWTSPDDWYSVSWAISPGFAVGLAQEEDACGAGPYPCEYEDFAFYRHTHTLVVERTDADCGEFTLNVTRTE